MARNPKMTATQLRGNFPGHTPKARKPSKPRETADIASIVKTRDPYTGERVSDGSKWDEVFRGCKEGDCFVMPPEETARTERALRKWLEREKINAIVRRQSKGEDGKGRVWLLKVLK
jgi:hypothetical protein